MFLYLFARFLFNPKLLLTDLRSEYGGYLSFLAAALAVFTLTLSSYVTFNLGGIERWFLSSMINLTLFIASGMFYLPLIHLFAEKNMPDARVSDLFVYSGFALSPLFLSLPLALIFLALNLPASAYILSLLVLFARILFNLISGIRDNYQLSAGKAVALFLTPLLYIFLFPGVILLFSAF